MTEFGPSLGYDYTVIMPSASRPHLLAPSLRSMFDMLIPMPTRLIIHDDAAFPDQKDAIISVIENTVPKHVDVTVLFDDPPIMHGPALYWLLSQLRDKDEYCFYTQDDWEFLRPVPVMDALHLLHDFKLNHIRFNKRETMPYKGEGETRWNKQEHTFARRVGLLKDGVSNAQYAEHLDPDMLDMPMAELESSRRILTLSDHWYFQASVWRVAHIKPVVDWWYTKHLGSFRTASEIKINKVMNGEVESAWPVEIPMPIPDTPARDHDTRARVQSTWIWGPIGEQPYIKHLGVEEKDFARKGDRPG